MSSFLRRYDRPMLCLVVAASAAGVYLLYQYLKSKKPSVDELIGLERRRRVEKLVELRDKLVCQNLSMLSYFD